MNILLVSECSKNALTETRRILDQFAERCGERTWQTPITEAGLTTLHTLLRRSARKNTAVACYYTHGKNRTDLLWIVGDKSRFNQQGRVPTNRSAKAQVVRENNWQYATTIQIAATLAALLHDLGKATVGFQGKLKRKKAKPSADPYRHEWLSLRLFEAMIDGCHDDRQWLERLIDWETYRSSHPDWYKRIYRDDKHDVDAPAKAFGHFPPFAKWIAWLVVSHHRLPFYDEVSYFGKDSKHILNNDFLKQSAAEYFQHSLKPVNNWVKNQNASDSQDDFWQMTSDLTVSTQWQKQVRRWAEKALNHRLLHELCENAEQNVITDPLLLHLSRLCLMAGDHSFSSCHRDVDAQKSYTSKLWANTSNKAQVKQYLDEHLCGVAHYTARFANILPNMAQNLPALAHHKPFKRSSTIPRFQWQNKAYQLAQSLQQQSAEQGFFGVNLAGTGCGKTLANARIMYGLADPERGARFTVALGLRVLTLQTGQALRARLQLNEEHLAVLVGGGSVVQDLFEQQNNEAMGSRPSQKSGNIAVNDLDNVVMGSESAQAWFDDNEYWDTEINGDAFTDESLSSVLRDPKARTLFNTPIISCTIDHLMQISEQTRGGRYIAPMLRLLSSDLILDEPDDFSTEDLYALSRLVYWAGLLGSRILLSSATLTPDMVIGLQRAYQDGRKIWNAHHGLPDVPAVCAWFDEFEQKSISGDEHFEEAHRTFCDSRIKHLQQQSPLRCAEWLDIESDDVDKMSSLILERAKELHQRYHETDPQSGKEISIGLVRFANINAMMSRVCALFKQDAGKEDAAVHVACYHGNQLLLLRSRLEGKLDRILNRNHTLLHEHPEIRDALDKSPAKQHIFMVFGTPVTEVGRDHDYDWAIIEPSSMRSIIQLAGRVWRHRPDKTLELPNIAIFSRNIRALKQINDPKKPAYYRPGFECMGFSLSDHDARQLITDTELNPIHSVPRLQAPQLPSEAPPKKSWQMSRKSSQTSKLHCNSFAQLEHYVMQEVLNSKKKDAVTALYRKTNGAAVLTAHHALCSPFRRNSRENLYTAWVSNDEDKWRFEECSSKGQASEKSINSLFKNKKIEDNTKGHIFKWLESSLNQELSAFVDDNDEDGLRHAALRYATVSLRSDGMESDGWSFHAWGGFWLDK